MQSNSKSGLPLGLLGRLKSLKIPWAWRPSHLKPLPLLTDRGQREIWKKFNIFLQHATGSYHNLHNLIHGVKSEDKQNANHIHYTNRRKCDDAGWLAGVKTTLATAHQLRQMSDPSTRPSNTTSCKHEESGRQVPTLTTDPIITGSDEIDFFLYFFKYIFSIITNLFGIIFFGVPGAWISNFCQVWLPNCYKIASAAIENPFWPKSDCIFNICLMWITTRDAR